MHEVERDHFLIIIAVVVCIESRDMEMVMALKKCKECGNQVSTGASTCPHCGVKNPTVSMKDNIGGLIMLAAIIFGIVKCTGGESKPEKTPEQVAKETAECKKDLQCWGDKNGGTAAVYCKEPVERLAKYSFEWTDGTLEQKFSHFRWKDKDNGIITYIGDKIKYQNGFGAWQNSTYECDIDPVSKTVFDVRASAGRL